jgi:hypothetical protein
VRNAPRLGRQTPNGAPRSRGRAWPDAATGGRHAHHRVDRHEALAIGVDERQRRVLIHDPIRGTHTSERLPFPPTGKSMESRCMLVPSFKNDRIDHAETVSNEHAMMQQVGWA